MKLNLGCGPDIKDGYVNIDTCPINEKVIKQDIRNLSFDSESIDEIYAKDILEHLSLDDAKKAIKNWSRICKSGAVIFIQTICWDSIVQAYASKVWSLETVIYMLFAGKNWVDGQSRPEDFHKSVYSIDLLNKILSENNFQIVSIDLDKIDEALIKNPYCHNLNVKVKAVKK
jgi:ubiquinone/menaquinone biosynthesis C-methylase UbiE